MGNVQRHFDFLPANVFGVQLLRVWLHNHRLQRKRGSDWPCHSEHVQTLLRDGVVVLPDFLDATEFDRVLGEFDQAWADSLFETRLKEATSISQKELELKTGGDHCPAITETFADNLVIREIIAGAVGWNFGEKGRLSIRRYARESEPRTAEHMVGIEYLHADVHIPAYKAFYFLADTDEKNGALVYALGSQRMTAARLPFEYRTSITTSWAKHRKLAYNVIPVGKLVTPNARERERMGVHETSLAVKANTLVIFDTAGFHRQGSFVDGRSRDVIFLNYSHVTRAA